MAVQSMDIKKLTGGGIALAALVALAAVFFLTQPGTGTKFTVSAGGSQAAPEQTVTITMKGQHFTVDRDTVKAGQPVSIVLVNNDTMNHQFLIASLGIDSGPIQRGQTLTVTFTPEKPGDIGYSCPMPGHITMGMFGTLHVTK